MTKKAERKAEKKTRKWSAFRLLAILGLFGLLGVWGTAAAAAGIEERVLKDWTRSMERSEGSGLQTVELKVTYYSAEYIEALVRAEAEKNLWTQDEEERYRYNLLKVLNLDERIAFHVAFNATGTPVYLQPFDKHLRLYAGKRTLEPVDYDKRFNFKLQGRRDGMIWFPRYDEKTGKNLLEGVKDLRLSISGSISQATMRAGNILFVWDITKDDPSILNTGTAAARLEMDRLIKRLEKLNTDRAGLQKQLNALDEELSTIDTRVDELQRQ
jgi:hypothetical protein